MIGRRRHNGSKIPCVLLRDDIGAVLIEFSLMAPFLFALAFGMVEFGRMFYQYQLVVEGLRDAGRYLARVDPTIDANQDSAANLAVTGTIDGTGDLRLTGWEADDITIEPEEVDNSAGDYRGPGTIYVIRVSTTFSYGDVGLLSALGLGPISIDASHEQRVIDRVWDIVPAGG